MRLLYVDISINICMNVFIYMRVCECVFCSLASAFSVVALHQLLKHSRHHISTQIAPQLTFSSYIYIYRFKFIIIFT